MKLPANSLDPNPNKWTAVLMGIITLWGAYYLSTINYLLFHSLAEIFTTVISFSMAIIVINSYHNVKNNFITIIGIAYGFAGGFDLLHTLAYNGMGVFPKGGTNLAPQMWIIARMLDSIGMFVAGISFHRTINPRHVLVAYIGVSVTALWAVFYGGIFPVCFIDGQGLTAFKIYSEYIISLILIASVLLLVYHRDQFYPKVFQMLLLFYLASICTELSFTFYRHMYGWENMVGHLFKITAFFFLYRAIVETSLKEPFNLMFFQLNQAYDLIKANEGKLVETQRLARVGSWEWDLINNQLQWSEQTYLNLGFAAREITPTVEAFLLCVHPQDRERVAQAIRDAMTKESHAIEFKSIKPDGTEAWLHVESYAVIDEQGNPTKLFGALQDITERKRSEELLNRSAMELAETNKELKAFANIVAHDFRAPMVNMKGFSKELGYALTELKRIIHDEIQLPEKVQKQVDGLLERDVPDALGFINSSVDKLDRIVAALLRVARLGRREMTYKEVDMSELVSVILRSFNHQIDKMGIRVELGSLPHIETDQLAIEQIISNLLDNAIKYLEPGRRGEIGIHCIDYGDKYLFSVQDNGRGIAAKNQEKIFEIFQRVEDKDVPGEGMGLAYVKTLIRQLGGKVWCESELGVGTKMNFTVLKNPMGNC